VLIPFGVGAAVVALLEIVAAFSLHAVGEVERWSSFDVRVGPILLFSFERAEHVSSLTLGSGVVMAAAAGGLLNAIGAAALHRRV